MQYKYNIEIKQILVDEIMRNEKDPLFYVVRKQKDCEFSLKFFLQKENGLWKNIFTMLKLVKKGTRKEVNYDYGKYVLGERLLEIKKGLDIISNLYPKNGEKGKLVIPDYDKFDITDGHQLDFASSKQRSGKLRCEWPATYRKFWVQQDKKGKNLHDELLKEGLPYYPSLIEAVVDFFELVVEHFSSHGEVYVTIIDYRARIETLRLSFSKAELKLDSPEIEFKNLVVKVFAKSGLETATLSDIYPKSELVNFDVGFQPDRLSVALLFRQDNWKIDGKEFAKWREEGEGVFTERSEDEILSLTRAGESQDLEYKQHVDDDSKKNDFIETVIAFLNTNSGIILVGVHDDGTIVGSQKNVEDFQKLIHDRCDPPPKNIKIEEKEISGKKVIVVEVPEGDNKPYQSKRDRNFYVRHAATDMKMERSELFHLLKENKEQWGVSRY